MSLEQKLSVYTIKLKPDNKKVENTNRWLFRNIIGETTSSTINDSFIFTELFAKFIKALDTQEMFSDESSHKCITINQKNVESEDVNTNVFLHQQKFVIEGRIEGGTYGRKRTKTSTDNKAEKAEVDEKDAITDNIYFMLYCPLVSNKSILILHSFSDNNVNSIVKKFIKNFFSWNDQFKEPVISRYIPKSIIDDFESEATVASLTYTTEVPGESLLEEIYKTIGQDYNVSITIKPIGKEFTVDEFNIVIKPIEKTLFGKTLNLGAFGKKKGSLRDKKTNKTTPFEIEDYKIKPSILLSKYIEIKNDDSDFDRIKEFSFQLLEEIKKEIYLNHAVQSR